jgi:uncharacterized protein YcbK (DUF882 family)
MNLTTNFKAQEFLVSSERPDLAKQMLASPEDMVKMFYLSCIFLQPVRDVFGTVHILSGKRSLELNAAIGGSKFSDHLYTVGTPKAAVDFTCSKANMSDVYEHIKGTRHGSYGQLLYYRKSNFIHVSLPNGNRLNDAREWDK